MLQVNVATGDSRIVRKRPAAVSQRTRNVLKRCDLYRANLLLLAVFVRSKVIDTDEAQAKPASTRTIAKYPVLAGLLTLPLFRRAVPRLTCNACTCFLCVVYVLLLVAAGPHRAAAHEPGDVFWLAFQKGVGVAVMEATVVRACANATLVRSTHTWAEFSCHGPRFRARSQMPISAASASRVCTGVAPRSEVEVLVTPTGGVRVGAIPATPPHATGTEPAHRSRRTLGQIVLVL
jgi:hypothetical protein